MKPTGLNPTPISDLQTDSPILADQLYRQGDSGAAVRVIQEWLCFHRIRVALDGEFGVATAAAVRLFQGLNDLAVDGVVGPLTKAALIRPMVKTLHPIEPQGRSLGELTLAYALQHSRENPREIGGSNRGPWVRLYMDEKEGTAWPWCAGFVSYVLRQAAQTLGVALPFTTSFSCDLLAIEAKRRKVFLEGTDALDYKLIKPGSLFLLRGKRDGDWVHTGIVIKAEPEVLMTVEGNTNGDGASEGVEVWRFARDYRNKDFILV
jgi:hypothetical protein